MPMKYCGRFSSVSALVSLSEVEEVDLEVGRESVARTTPMETRDTAIYVYGMDGTSGSVSMLVEGALGNFVDRGIVGD